MTVLEQFEYSMHLSFTILWIHLRNVLKNGGCLRGAEIPRAGSGAPKVILSWIFEENLTSWISWMYQKWDHLILPELAHSSTQGSPYLNKGNIYVDVCFYKKARPGVSAGRTAILPPVVLGIHLRAAPPALV